MSPLTRIMLMDITGRKKILTSPFKEMGDRWNNPRSDPRADIIRAFWTPDPQNLLELYQNAAVHGLLGCIRIETIEHGVKVVYEGEVVKVYEDGCVADCDRQIVI